MKILCATLPEMAKPAEVRLELALETAVAQTRKSPETRVQ